MIRLKSDSTSGVGDDNALFIIGRKVSNLSPLPFRSQGGILHPCERKRTPVAYQSKRFPNDKNLTGRTRGTNWHHAGQ